MLKKIKKISLILLLLFFTCIASSIIFLISHYFDTVKTSQKFDCIVVFGAAVWKNNIPSHALYDRTYTASQLYHQKISTCIIISGGKSQYSAHEVDVMKKILLHQNIPEIAIHTDYNGINTQATIQNLIPEKKYLFISNDFHLARIRLLAWQNHITYYDTHKALYKSGGRYYKESYFIFREIIAIIYYFFHFSELLQFFF